MIGVATSGLQPPESEPYRTCAPKSPKMTIFCDFDGPIVDVSERYYATYKLALAQTETFYAAKGIVLPVQKLTKSQFWQMKQERVPDVEIAMRSGLQGGEIDFFLGRVARIVNQPNLLKKDKLQPGVDWALKRLHSQGVRLVLVTLRCQCQATQILRNYGLKRLFSGIYGTHDRQAAYRNYAECKQNLLETAIAEHLSLAPEQACAWMVGDTEADLLAGHALAIPTIALTCGIRSKLYLKQFQPTRICGDLLAVSHYLLEKKQPVTR